MDKGTRQALLDAAGRLELEAGRLRLLLRDRRGERRPRTLAAIAERNKLIAALAARDFGGLPIAVQARAVKTRIDRYRSAAGRRQDRSSDARPIEDSDLWQITKAPPVSLRTIRGLLTSKK